MVTILLPLPIIPSELKSRSIRMHEETGGLTIANVEEVIAWLRGDGRGCNGDEFDLQKSFLQHSVQSASVAFLETLFRALIGDNDQASIVPGRLRLLLQYVASQFLSGQKNRNSANYSAGHRVEAALLAQLYMRVVDVEFTAAAHVLQCLAAQEDDESLVSLVTCLSARPLKDGNLVGLALSPLWRANPDVLRRLFAKTHQILDQPTVLAVLLDLANHSMRSARLPEHPLMDSSSMLSNLLRQLVYRLEMLHESPASFGDSVEQIQRVLGDSVGMAISLCDALGLIGRQEATTALLQAMKLSHRRVQVEAAAALVRLGEPRGRERLIALAADPVARLKVVQYTEELDILEDIPQDYRNPLALFESEFAIWLASPENFGVSPNKIENIDSRTLYWPGYEEPRDCALFRFQYELPGGGFSNVGIAGPLTHAFSVNIEGLELDDMYAAFAGWHAEHDEIFEVPAHQLNAAQQAEARRLERVFQKEGFKIEAIVALTFLLGEPALLARLTRDGEEFVAVTDGTQVTSFEGRERHLSNNPELVLAIYRGRRLLSAFNE